MGLKKYLQYTTRIDYIYRWHHEEVHHSIYSYEPTAATSIVTTAYFSGWTLEMHSALVCVFEWGL